MANDKFTIKEALKYGWETFKANVPFFIGYSVVIALLTLMPDFLADKLFEPRSMGLLIAKLILRFFGLILAMISTRLSLDIHDSGRPDLSRISTVVPQILPYFFGKVLYGLIVMVGLILLIVPGVFLAYMFLYVGYLIIDRGMGPVEALSESRTITDGYKWDLFVFTLVILLLNLLGLCALFVGLFVTAPVALMASAYVYRRLVPAEPAAEIA